MAIPCRHEHRTRRGAARAAGRDLEELADLATDLLRMALDSHEEHERVRLAAQEKRVTKARRAVEKAVAELTG